MLGLPPNLFEEVLVPVGREPEVVPPPPPYPPPQSPRYGLVNPGPQYTPGGTPVPLPRVPEREVKFGGSPDFLPRDLGRTEVNGPPVPQYSGDQDERAERLEKYIPDLPTLSLSGDASTIVSDWLALATPIISSLSPSAGNWWRQVVAEAQSTYAMLSG